MSYFFDPVELVALGEKLRGSYDSADPFPHVVIDEFLTTTTLDEILPCFPPPADPYWRSKVSITSIKQDSPRMDKELFLPTPIRHVIWALNSAAFLLFLNRLTGIDGLVPDPYLEGGGIHQIERGGFLKIHADFNRHPLIALDRRINVLIYLNKEWDARFGGNLELWSKDMRRCVRSIEPVAGRCVIFNTTDWALHGHPEPLACPAELTRKSIAMYYYSNGRPERERSKVHDTLYRRRPNE